MTLPIVRLAAALLVLAPATAPSTARASALIDNVRGATLDRQGRVVRFGAIVLSPDGKVEALVPLGDKPPRPKDKRWDWRADLGGRVVVPGMIDAHAHLTSLGLAALTLDLSDTASLAEAQARIAAWAKANPDRPWIIGRGWNQERWGLGRFPTAAELDAATGGRPAWLERADGHAGWANGAALRAADVTAATVAPHGGRIESGVFVDAAAALVEKAVPKPGAKDLTAAFLKAQQILLGYGVTAIAEMATTAEDWMTFRRMGDSGNLRIRIMCYGYGIDTTTAIGGTGPTPWLYDDRLRLNGVKLFADGALGSRGAWLKRPYADAPGQSGLGFLTDAQLQNSMSRAAMDGYQVAVHAIGDRANAQVLDAVQVLAETYGGDRRWRIEHAQVLAPDDLPRFAKLGVIASMQPLHATSDRTMAEARLGPERLAGAYAWHSLLASGAKLAFGSDAPVERPDPWAGWAAAMTRSDTAGQPAGGWRPEERVTREQAWWAYTGGASYAGFAENRFGILAPGQRADFLVVDRDPTVVSPAELRGTRVLETWIGGAKVWGGGK